MLLAVHTRSLARGSSEQQTFSWGWWLGWKM